MITVSFLSAAVKMTAVKDRALGRFHVGKPWGASPTRGLQMDRRTQGASISLACGMLMALSSAPALIVPLAEPGTAKGTAAAMLFAGGMAEIAVGLFGTHLERGLTDVVLGLLSVGAASILAFAGGIGALSFLVLLAAWLLARGATELTGGLAAETLAALPVARLIRGWMDILLGLVALIASLAAASPLLLLVWPAAIVRSSLLLVAASLLASAGVHIWLAASFGGRGRSPRD
jgi:uncharacterized membrane protein HdeD (DUF308 family)